MASQMTFTVTGKAGAALQWGQFVKRNGSGDFIPCNTLGEKFEGVVASGSHEIGDTEVLVAVGLEANILTGDATITALDTICTDANGRAVKAPTTSGTRYVARALRAGRAAVGGEHTRIRCAIPLVPVAVTTT